MILGNYSVTIRCNSKCKFCDIWWNQQDLDSKHVEPNLSEIEHNLRLK
jgi:MoaA/NifB/PqqE/SkfB family radical SAM enzyme